MEFTEVGGADDADEQEEYIINQKTRIVRLWSIYEK